MPTEDGYPTDDELTRIREWSDDDLPGWFAFIRSCWWYPDWGWREEQKLAAKPIVRYYISTGGWTGNEEIVSAMQDNFVAWSLTWQSVRRGGHYVFEREVARDVRVRGNADTRP